LITQISKEDYKDFWTFSEIFELSIDSHLPNFYIRVNLFFGERRERGCLATTIDARNVTRNLLPCSASESTMLGRRNVQNVVGKNWNNSLALSR
jgi:hypothetical protein